MGTRNEKVLMVSDPEGLTAHGVTAMGDKIGLALGAGSARGWAHIGVLRALAEAGIHPDIIAGTSVGAVVGGCYVAGEIDALEQFARGLTRRKVLGFLDFNLSGSGLIHGQRLRDVLEARLKAITIESLARRFVAVATEIGSGHEVWLSRGHLGDAIRASYAMPGIFKPVAIDGRWLFDGALVNPVPVSVCRALGARYVIAVNVNTEGGHGTVVTDLASGARCASSSSASCSGARTTARRESPPLCSRPSTSCRTALPARAWRETRPT